MNALLSRIGQLAIFLICAQTLIHFRPKDSYEKYIKLLVSMMLLILLVEPVMDVLGKGEQGEFLERVRVYEKQLQEIVSSPQLETAQMEVILQNITRQKVEDGEILVQEQGKERMAVADTEQAKEVMVNGNRIAKSTEAIVVQVEVDTIQEVEVGDVDGKSENNN